MEAPHRLAPPLMAPLPKQTHHDANDYPCASCMAMWFARAAKNSACRRAAHTLAALVEFSGSLAYLTILADVLHSWRQEKRTMHRPTNDLQASAGVGGRPNV
eukprot:365255-Chlamydomonas_euryale.AAC.37